MFNFQKGFSSCSAVAGGGIISEKRYNNLRLSGMVTWWDGKVVSRKIWNELPPNLRNLPSKKIFGKHYEQFLLQTCWCILPNNPLNPNPLSWTFFLVPFPLFFSIVFVLFLILFSIYKSWIKSSCSQYYSALFAPISLTT